MQLHAEWKMKKAAVAKTVKAPPKRGKGLVEMGIFLGRWKPCLRSRP